MRKLYKYQEELVADVLKKFKTQHKVVLAAAPSSGKTMMGLAIAKRYKKVLVLASGFTLVRKQWAEYLDGGSDPHVVISAETIMKDIPKECIIICVPQSLNKKRLAKIGDIDLLVVDEAHQRYFAKQVPEIIKKTNPKKELLLTGSPSVYNDKPKFDVIGISIADLLKQEVVFDPKIRILESSFDIKPQDYNAKFEVKKSKRFTPEQVVSTLERVVPEIHQHGKTMLVAPRQSVAIAMAKWLETKGIAHELSISSLGNGQKELDSFLNDPRKQFIVVVSRGTIGFDYSELQTIVDFSFTMNVDRVFQTICRLIRKPKSHHIAEKQYIKIANDAVAAKTFAVVSMAVALSQDSQYFSFSKDPTKWNFWAKQSKNWFLRNKIRTDLHKMHLKDLPEILSMKELSELQGHIGEMATMKFSDFTRVRYTDESAMSLARQYPTRKLFKTAHHGAYNYFADQKKLHLLDELWPTTPIYKWAEHSKRDNLEKLQRSANELGVKYLWRAKNRGGFQWLKKHNLEHLITFRKTLRKWDRESVMEVAAGFISAKRFRKAYGGAFDYAERNGFIKELPCNQRPGEKRRMVFSTPRYSVPQGSKEKYFGSNARPKVVKNPTLIALAKARKAARKST